jgi:CRP-like cAMP-binding protein
MASLDRPSNQLLQALSAVEFETLRPRLRPFEMVRDSVLAEAGSALTQVYFPHDGTVSIVVRLSEGQTLEAAMIGRDSAIGAFEALDDGISSTDAVVLFPGTASIVDLDDFKTVAGQSTKLRILVARHEQALLAQVQQSAACNTSHSVEARLSRWLLRARDLNDGGSLALTQELLARMIGVQRNAVSIVAHSLQQAGIIGYSRGQIEITNVEALRQMSCGCYEQVKARQQHLTGAITGASAR